MNNNSIADALDRDYASAWRPEAGDKLIGTVSLLSEREGYDGDPYPIVTVKTDTGEEWAFHAFHTVAKNELAKLRPQVGDQIGIKYIGRVKSANGRSSYHAYRISNSSARGVNWSKYDDDTAPDMPADTAGLPEPTPAPMPGAQFGDDPAW